MTGHAWRRIVGSSCLVPLSLTGRGTGAARLRLTDRWLRALALNLVDVVSDWQEGSELLADLLDQPGADGLEEAAAASTGVERLLVGQGLGPGRPWAR